MEQQPGKSLVRDAAFKGYKEDNTVVFNSYMVYETERRTTRQCDYKRLPGKFLQWSVAIMVRQGSPYKDKFDSM